MSRYGSADVGFLLVSGLDVLGDITDLEDTRGAVLEETTVLGSAWEEHAYVGVKTYELTQQGFYNDAAARSNAALVTPGSSKVLSFAPEGNTLGKKCISSPLVQVDYKRQIQRGALTKASASYKSEGGHDEGIILHALGAESGSSGNTQGAGSQDAGASSSAGGGGVLQVTALTLGGYDNLVWKIQHSADDSTYVDLITFTAVTVVGAERKTVTGTVNRHLASAWAYGGSGTGQSNTAMVAFARG